MKTTKTERDQAIERLREWFPKGSTVYTILRHVSRSGMQRTIGLVSLRGQEDGRETNPNAVDIRHPNYAASEVLGYTLDKQREGVKVGGCGMDMGFAVVYDLARVLYDDGYALKHEWL